MTVRQTHCEVGVRVVRQFLLVAHLGVAEVALLLLDRLAHVVYHAPALVVHSLQSLCILVAGVLCERLLRELNLLAALHQNGCRPQPLYILACVAAELLLDGLVELGQVFLSHILTEVVDERSLHVLVESRVPLCAVVGEAVVGLRLLAALLWHHSDECERTCVELAGARECLAPYGAEFVGIEALCVEVLHLLEVELALQVAGPLLILLDAVLEVSLLADDAHGVDALVHTERVLPVVGALRILRVVLDAHSLVGTHVAYHHRLLHAAYLGTRSVLSVAHLAYAVA